MSTILVHQTLHGYDDGHRLITSSLPLSAPDARVMLVMSDLSGPGVKPSLDGYLTGYPLEKSGKYVLARTWAAPEMPRPGCVWTHSLIIDNADLARMVSAQTLLDDFARPAGMSTRSIYGVQFPVSPLPKPTSTIRTKRIEFLLQALYSSPTQQVVAKAVDPLEDERIATAIWMQQWPRLRRSFGFCTLAGMDRSGKGIALDLQFAHELDRKLQLKFPDAVIAEQGAISEALQPLVVDLTEPGSSTLREFLKRTGGDVDGGRRAMLPLCELHKSLLESHPPNLSAAIAALGLLDGNGRSQARSIRKVVAREAMKSSAKLENNVFEFLLDTLNQSSDLVEQSQMADKLGAELWKRSPLRFYSALISEGALHNGAYRALAGMKSEEILSGLRNNGSIANEIGKLRPDILTLQEFWCMPEADELLLDWVSEHDIGAVAQALIAAGRIGPARIVIGRVDAAELAQALESDAAIPDAKLGWLTVLCRDKNKTAEVLATGQIKNMATNLAVARLVHPDDIPNLYGEDPWLIAIREASGSLDQTEADFLAAFLLARALGRESKSQAGLLRYSYTRVYNAFQERRFSRETEILASGRLIWSTWLDWDVCSRLRETVTKVFIEQELSPEVFGRLTDDGQLAIDLLNEAAHTGRGRKFLAQVSNSLKDSGEKGMKARVEHIARKLK